VSIASKLARATVAAGFLLVKLATLDIKKMRRCGSTSCDSHAGEPRPVSDSVVRTTISPDGQCRVVVTRRSFGAYSVQRQWRVATADLEEWEPLSLYLGVYDSPESAEAEAFARPRWKRSG
jgi:hypothetical protein